MRGNSTFLMRQLNSILKRHGLVIQVIVHSRIRGTMFKILINLCSGRNQALGPVALILGGNGTKGITEISWLNSKRGKKIRKSLLLISSSSTLLFLFYKHFHTVPPVKEKIGEVLLCCWIFMVVIIGCFSSNLHRAASPQDHSFGFGQGNTGDKV